MRIQGKGLMHNPSKNDKLLGKVITKNGKYHHAPIYINVPATNGRLYTVLSLHLKKIHCRAGGDIHGPFNLVCNSDQKGCQIHYILINLSSVRFKI